MFQPSHFQKMAKHLGIDSLSYEKEYNGFMAKLKNFHESKGTPFRRLPWLGGQYLDLYLLYRKVTSAGGWVKVTEGKMWRDIAEVFNLPPTCTNAAFALRQHYSRYLESFERINFFGEDAEDVLAAGRPHTPVGGGTFPTHIPSVATTDYISVISTSKDPTRNFDKLVLSLQCGMPNEVDFAINICMLLSNVSNSVFNLSKAPAVVDTLLAHIGVFSEDMHGLKELHDEWYFKQDMERDFVKFWKESLRVKGVQEILSGKGEEIAEEESLFHPAKRKAGAKDAECQRISQVGMILYNFSFDDTNAGVLASHPLCLRFLVLCICSDHGFLQRMAWETLSNLAEKMLLEPIESSSTQMFFHMLHFFLDHKDRYHVTNAMDVLGKLCTLEGNDEVIEAGLEPEAYESLIKVLIVSDVQLVLSSLESLYNLSGVGQVTSDHIAEVHHSIDVLVCLVTMDAEAFGPEALSEVQILEKRMPTALPATPKPQPAPMPVVPQQPKEPVVQHQAPPSSPSPGPIPSPAPNPVPIKTTGSEIDPETFTYHWLQGTYEPSPGSSVSRIDIYADYLSSCSRLARVGILNATSFNRIIKLAFPDGQLRRVQSGVNVQYVLAGLKRRTNPLAVKSRTDSAAVTQQPGSASPHAPVQRLSPGQQSIARTHTQPAQNQMPPAAWNSPRQQSVGIPQQSPMQPMPGAFDQRSAQVPGGIQQQQQQLPGMDRVPRRPSFSNQGTIQTTSDQGIRQFPATAMQHQGAQTATDRRQIMGGQVIQRTIVPSDKEQSRERLAAVRRASVEGMNSLPGQNPQSFPHPHNQGQVMQRMPFPPQSPGEHQQQTAYPAKGHPMPETVSISPGQRTAPGAQLMAKPPHPTPGGAPQSPHSRSPLPPPRPIQPPTTRPAQTPPPTGFMPRAPSPAEPPSYRPTAVYRQPAPSYPQQQSIRPAPPAYNSRPAYHGSYPPLAPKPAPAMNVQFTQQSQARNQVPSSSTTAVGRYPGSPPVPSSPLQRVEAVRQNFQPQTSPPNMPPSPLLSPSVGSGQPFASPQQDLPGGFTGRNGRPTLVQDSRQANKDPLAGRRPEGVVLIAQEERAADVVSTGLLEGAEEQKIIVIENKNRTEMSTKGETTNHSTSTQHVQVPYSIATNQVIVAQNSTSVMCRSNIDGNVEQPLGRTPVSVSEGEKNALLNTPKTTFYPASNGSLKRDLNAHHMMHDSSEENLNGQRDSVSGNCGTVKRPRLDKRMSSLENELENSSSIPSRTGSPTPLVNGDIKGDPRNKLMDKLLDKDLHLPLNGVCGIDTSELDLLASDGERLSSSKASSPDLFGSETNSDFGKYLEESDTDTGLFSDVLQGDLRIDPMENGTEGTHPMPSKMPTFPGGPYNDGGSMPNEKGVPSGVTEQQGKIPIPPAVRPDPQRLHEGAMPGQYNVAVNRNPVALTAVWNSTNTVTQVAKAGYGHQPFAPEVQQKMSVYSQQGNLPPNVGSRSHMENKKRLDPAQGSAVTMQKPAFQHQNIQSNPHQVMTAQEFSPTMHPPGLPQNALPGPQGPGFANSMVPAIQGSSMRQPSSAPPPYQGRQQMPTIQTSHLNADSSRGMQPAIWAQSRLQQQQVPVAQHAGAGPQSGPQKVGPAGFLPGLQQNSMPGSQVPTGPQNTSGWQPQLQQQQKAVNAYPDIRTQSASTPGEGMYDAVSAPLGRQPTATVPPQYQHPGSPAAGKIVVPNPTLSTPGALSESQEFVSTPADSTVPQAVPFKPYRCRWSTCYSSFDTSKSLFSHVVNEHIPRDSLVISCMWEGCPPVRRSRSSLLFHLQQKHSEPSSVTSALPPQPVPAQHQPPPVQPPPPQPQAPPPNQPASFVPAYHFLARMLQSLQGEEESPLTKSVRLTAALVLRNVAQYSALARSMLRRHESHLSLVAMSNSEAANAIAACLSELSPHRKASSNDSDSFIWALNR